jgi:hypothetical protein
VTAAAASDDLDDESMTEEEAAAAAHRWAVDHRANSLDLKIEKAKGVTELAMSDDDDNGEGRTGVSAIVADEQVVAAAEEWARDHRTNSLDLKVARAKGPTEKERMKGTLDGGLDGGSGGEGGVGGDPSPSSPARLDGGVSTSGSMGGVEGVDVNAVSPKTKTCRACGGDLEKASYSSKQRKAKADKRRCKECVEAENVGGHTDGGEGGAVGGAVGVASGDGAEQSEMMGRGVEQSTRGWGPGSSVNAESAAASAEKLKKKSQFFAVTQHLKNDKIRDMQKKG